MTGCVQPAGLLTEHIGASTGVRDGLGDWDDDRVSMSLDRALHRPFVPGRRKHRPTHGECQLWFIQVCFALHAWIDDPDDGLGNRDH